MFLPRAFSFRAVAVLIVIADITRSCNALAIFPKRPVPLTFVTPNSSLQKSAGAVTARTWPSSSRRRVIRSLSQSVEEEDDGSFFLKASQQASQQRMQQVRDGEHPLSISLSTSNIVGDTKEDSNEEGENMLWASGEIEKEIEDFQYEEIKIPIEPFQQREQQKEEEGAIETKPLSSYEFQRNLLEARLRMSKKDVAKEGKEFESASETKEVGSEVDTEALSSSVGTEKEMAENKPAIDSTIATTPEIEEANKELAQAAKEDLVVDTDAILSSMSFGEQDAQGVEAETDSTIVTSQDIEEANDEQPSAAKEVVPPPETETANSPGLSSDGKEIFEPSAAQLEMNQENVDMGIMVLTRSLLALKSIVDKKKA